MCFRDHNKAAVTQTKITIVYRTFVQTVLFALILQIF